MTFCCVLKHYSKCLRRQRWKKKKRSKADVNKTLRNILLLVSAWRSTFMLLKFIIIKEKQIVVFHCGFTHKNVCKKNFSLLSLAYDTMLIRPKKVHKHLKKWKQPHVIGS